MSISAIFTCSLQTTSNISTHQNWTSPIETLQEKEKNDTSRNAVGCKVIKLWPVKVCRNSVQLKFLVISVVHIFKWLFLTKTKNALSRILSGGVINFIHVRYLNLMFLLL